MIERISGVSDEAGQSLSSQMKAHQRLGWKYIELRNIMGKPVDTLTSKEAVAVANQLSTAGLQVNCLASRIGNWQRTVDFDMDTEQCELERLIEFSQLTGNRYIRIMSYLNSGYGEKEWRDRSITRIHKLVEMAEKGGVILVHENCSGWAGVNADNTQYLLQSISSPALKLLLDLGNGLAYKNKPSDFLEQCFDSIVHVHIKDGIVKEGGHVRYTYPGQGKASLSHQLKTLMKKGYQGLFSIEPHIEMIVHEGANQLSYSDMSERYIRYGVIALDLLKESQSTVSNTHRTCEVVG
ncbi:sugar phosphate isomerase/epimerase family protein [Algicola sagamiensis]|uniref:sugar phosphate isomerase/epimerase family protein n=1 Tax=Algicola sagamiensis TaxID=163869 RepID=UPI00035CA99C|nr:sugar phosphate isomerase/epimerase family protein [Algicola sagamiensis]